eukprot:TRINITY_DN6020_c0_g2_i1.p2 TRINITY_DN6020_c0_g2~~TRINITY_DN6020_c0_g2_i1.p2  ORF type:complete len:165 (+),score=23.20 TRINITY_DN6020_c0_g2_i1:224-718(+)
MYIYDPLSQSLTTKAAHGTSIAKFALPPNKGIVGLVFTSQNSVILPSAYMDKRFDRSVDKSRASITRDMVCVPLKAGGRCVGCLEVANRRELKFGEEDLGLVEAVGKELASGIVLRNERDAAGDFLKAKSRFKTKIRAVADNNLLSPLLKNILMILAEILKAEM